jgi:hypothetical protein
VCCYYLAVLCGFFGVARYVVLLSCGVVCSAVLSLVDEMILYGMKYRIFCSTSTSFIYLFCLYVH